MGDLHRSVLVTGGRHQASVGKLVHDPFHVLGWNGGGGDLVDGCRSPCVGGAFTGLGKPQQDLFRRRLFERGNDAQI